jgi:hypothetical protein
LYRLNRKRAGALPSVRDKTGTIARREGQGNPAPTNQKKRSAWSGRPQASVSPSFELGTSWESSVEDLNDLQRKILSGVVITKGKVAFLARYQLGSVRGG